MTIAQAGKVLAIVISILAAGAWIERQESDLTTLQSHLQKSCYALCMQRCQRWCEDQGIPPNECRCALSCERECG